jgi:DNA segregation ATPase FtsK/SpoIIIE-like protein
MDAEGFYFVVLKNADHFDLRSLADMLSHTLGIHRADAATRLKRSWGLLHKTRVIDEAEKLQERLEQAGMDTFVLPSSRLRNPPQPIVLRKGIPQQKGMAYEDKGYVTFLRWSHVNLLCAGQVEETVQTTERRSPDGKAKKWLLRTGLSPITAVAIQHERSKVREVKKERTESNCYLDLIAGGNYDSIRIPGDSFDYSCLGSKMAHNTLVNFKTLALDIGKFLTHTIKNQGMRAMETQPVAQGLKYGSFDDFENEKLWLMQLMPD